MDTGDSSGSKEINRHQTRIVIFQPLFWWWCRPLVAVYLVSQASFEDEVEVN